MPRLESVTTPLPAHAEEPNCLIGCPNGPMSGKRHRTIVVSSEEDSDESDGSLDSLGSFIVPSDEEEGDDCDDSDDSDGEEVYEEEDESDENEDDAEEGAGGLYVPKEEMRKMYKKNPDLGEQPGYVASREHTTQLSPEETWRHITNTLGSEAARRRFGVEARDNGGVRVIERFDYGSERDKSSWNRGFSKAGSYEKILVPLIEDLFAQKAYQPPPDGDKIPKYAFSGWKIVMDSTDVTKELSDEVQVNDLWCICCQNSVDKEGGLKHIQILQHEKSGVHILTGGDCAANMLGRASREEAAAQCPPCDLHDMRNQFRRIMYTGRSA